MENQPDIKRKKKIAFSLLGSLFIVAVLVWTALVSTKGGEGSLIVNFLDVGQGDAILIEAPMGEVLIDGGPGRQVLEQIGKTMPYFDRKIELVILTHPDSDHINGLVEVLKSYKVDAIIETGVQNDNSGYSEWQRLIRDKGIKNIIAQKGDKIDLGEGIWLDFIWPEGEFFNNDKELNNSSIVNILDWGETEVILTGDAEKEALDKIAQNNEGIDVEVMKQSHHGAKNGNSEKFLAAFKPEVSIISVGAKNRYKHPHQDTLDILERLGIKIYRTDEQGTIRVIINKDSYQIQTQK